MSKKHRRLRADRRSPNYVYRAGQVQATADDAIRLVLATETPVRVYDWEHRMVVDEVLRMDGLEFSGQVPMLDSHMRYESRNVIGSIRELQVRGDKLEGSAYFASDELAQSIKRLYDEGHMTDFSIGFSPTDVRFIDKGDKETINGREYTGPLRVVTKAKVKEGSTVPIGADENAKALPAMRAYVEPDQLLEEFEMNELRKEAIRLGMPEDHEDVIDWISEQITRKNTPDPSPPAVQEDDSRQAASDTPKVDVEKLIVEERDRVVAVTDLCSKHGIDGKQTIEWIGKGLTRAEVADEILSRGIEQNTGDRTGSGVEPGESQMDKMTSRFGAVLLQRCLVDVNLDRAEMQARGETYDARGNRIAAGKMNRDALARVESVKQVLQEDFSHDLRAISMVDMARAFCTQAGIDTRFKIGHEIVREALKLSTRDAAYHTTGSLANVLLDAANKTLLMAYDEALVTYPTWTRQAPSAPDFKSLNRIRFGEIPDPEVVTENGKYSEAEVGDAKESYRVEKYGNLFSITLEAIVNDDLNAISRIPQLQGNAMRRKVNKVVYQVLADNAAMGDGIAIFHSTSHGANLDSNALSPANLSTGFQVMMLQTGVSSDTVLNLQPRFLLVPAALSATALQIINSVADPTQTSSRPAFNEGTVNLYGPQGPRRLIPVIDANIDSLVSGTAWYLTADTSQIDTVEVTFLRGEEAPVLEREMGFEVDAIRYKIRQTFAAKAIDYRGLYQGNS